MAYIHVDLKVNYILKKRQYNAAIKKRCDYFNFANKQIHVHTALTDGISISSPKTYTPGASNVWFMRATNPAPLADLANKTYCSRL